MADSELAIKLQKQIARNTSADNLQIPPPSMSKVFNPYTEFKDFTRKDLQSLEQAFKK
jgi:EF-hand domain-containing family member D2